MVDEPSIITPTRRCSKFHAQGLQMNEGMIKASRLFKVRPSSISRRWPRQDYPKGVKTSSFLRYLIVRNVPALGCVDELVKLFGLYGPIEEYRLLDEEECEPFTDVILIKFIYIGNARFSKRKLDEHPFFGNLLQVTYAPEYETLLDTKDKLEERRHTVRSRLIPNKQRGPNTQAVSSSVEPDALPEPSSLPGTLWKYPKFPLEQATVKTEETNYSASGISQCQERASGASMLTAQYFSSSSMNATVQSVRDSLDKIANASLPSQSRIIDQPLGKREIHGSLETSSSLKKTRHDNRRRI